MAKRCEPFYLKVLAATPTCLADKICITVVCHQNPQTQTQTLPLWSLDVVIAVMSDVLLDRMECESASWCSRNQDAWVN